MTFDELEGRRFAMGVMQDAFRSPSATNGGAIDSALKNLERNARNKPAGYAKGIRDFVEQARKLIEMAS